jgi:hypothetical protein
MGTADLALMLEGATNAGIEDVIRVPSKVAKIATKSFAQDGRNSGRRQSASV